VSVRASAERDAARSPGRHRYEGDVDPSVGQLQVLYQGVGDALGAEQQILGVADADVAGSEARGEPGDGGW
jgi:hypothetical protein